MSMLIDSIPTYFSLLLVANRNEKKFKFRQRNLSSLSHSRWMIETHIWGVGQQPQDTPAAFHFWSKFWVGNASEGNARCRERTQKRKKKLKTRLKRGRAAKTTAFEKREKLLHKHLILFESRWKQKYFCKWNEQTEKKTMRLDGGCMWSWELSLPGFGWLVMRVFACFARRPRCFTQAKLVGGCARAKQREREKMSARLRLRIYVGIILWLCYVACDMELFCAVGSKVDLELV